MISKNCTVEGIERVAGNRKTDGKEFAFWKLHLTTEFPKRNGEPAGTGTKTLTVNVDDATFHQDCLTLGSTVDVFSRGQYTEYIGESA